jgi:hypothetical protein
VEEHPTEALASLARALYTTEIVIHIYVESERLAASGSVAADVAVVPVSTPAMALVLDRLARRRAREGQAVCR